jgi:hypothetical protein
LTRTLTIKIITNLTKSYLNFRLSKRIEELNESTSLRYTKIDLEQLFDSLFNTYSSILRDNGIFGAWKERKAILEEINSISFGMFDKKSKYLLEPDFNEALSRLDAFKNILINIKYSVELLLIAKTIFSLITKISFLPIFILGIWIIIRKVYIASSLLFTSSLATVYLTNHYDYISKTYDYLLAIRLILRELSIKWHNWLFNDDLISKKEVEQAIDKFVDSNYTGLMSKVGDYFNSSYEYLSSVSIMPTASYVSYTGAALLTITASYLVYTGVITPMPAIKKVGSTLWLIASYFGFGPLPDDGTNPPPTGGSTVIYGVDTITVDRGKGRDLDSLMSDRPAAIKEGILIKGNIGDIPPDSATFKWSLPYALKDTAGVDKNLIEVSLPPAQQASSPTGSVDSNKTIKASVETQDSSSFWRYPNLVIYPPINNNNNNNPPSNSLLEAVLIPQAPPAPHAATYPDSNLGIWQDIYIKYSNGVGTPESYEHFTALNERFPNLTAAELEIVCNKIKTGDNSIFKDYPAIRRNS